MIYHKPHNPVPPTGEQRFDALVEQVDTLSQTHGSASQRALNGDLSSVLHDPSHELHDWLKEIAFYARNKTPADLANSIAKQIIFETVLRTVPDPADLTPTFDASVLDRHTTAGSWTDDILQLAGPSKKFKFLTGSLLSTQTNFPDRWQPLKYVLRANGVEHASLAELGTAAGWLLKLGIIEDDGFDLSDVSVGSLGPRGQFHGNKELSAKFNERTHAPGFDIQYAKGYDLSPVKSPYEQARAKISSLYIEQLLDPVSGAQLQRLIDYPWPDNLELVNEDLSLDPTKFAELHPDDVGRYDAVLIPTMANQLPSPQEQRNLLHNAHLLRKLGGMILFLDYGKFTYPTTSSAIRRQDRNILAMSQTWNHFVYSLWVDDGSHGDNIHFELFGKFRSGRANDLALSRKARNQLRDS